MTGENRPKYIPRETYCKLPYVECDGVCVGMVDDEHKSVYDWGNISICENFLGDVFYFLGEDFPSTRVELIHGALKDIPEMEFGQPCDSCKDK